MPTPDHVADKRFIVDFTVPADTPIGSDGQSEPGVLAPGTRNPKPRIRRREVPDSIRVPRLPLQPVRVVRANLNDVFAG